MARRPKTPVRAASIERMRQSLSRTLRAEGRSEKTVYSYDLSARLLSDYLDADGKPTTIDVSRDDVREFIADQIIKNSPATALVRFKSLQQFFRHCVAEQELDASPMVGMSAPDVKEVPVPVVADDVLERLLKSRSGKPLGDRRDTAILRIFLDTGCRLAEVTNLRLSDVDLERQLVTVRGKGDRVRITTFGLKTAAALDRYLRQLERERPESLSEPFGWLWVGRQGRMTTSGLTDVLHRMCDDAGVPRLHWHQLRHTFAHTWLAEGGTEGDLMALAGWRSRSMLDRYAKSAQVERAARRVACRLSLGDRG